MFTIYQQLAQDFATIHSIFHYFCWSTQFFLGGWATALHFAIFAYRSAMAFTVSARLAATKAVIGEEMPTKSWVVWLFVLMEAWLVRCLVCDRFLCGLAAIAHWVTGYRKSVGISKYSPLSLYHYHCPQLPWSILIHFDWYSFILIDFLGFAISTSSPETILAERFRPGPGCWKSCQGSWKPGSISSVARSIRLSKAYLAHGYLRSWNTPKYLKYHLVGKWWFPES